MEVRQAATKTSKAVSRRSEEERVEVRSPNGEGREERDKVVVVAAAVEKRELAEEAAAAAAAVEGIVMVVVGVEEEWESLLEWPKVLSLLKREAIVIFPWKGKKKRENTRESMVVVWQ